MEHDLIISRLEKHLKEQGCITQTCEEFNINGRKGECDLYGFDFKNRILCVYEVKSHHNPKNFFKARYQLQKDEEYLKRLFFDFAPFKLVKFYCYSSRTEETNRIAKEKVLD